MREAFFVVIRGPLGVGKTSVARLLAERIEGEHLRIDQILEERGFEEWDADYISLESFLRVNEVAAELARGFLSSAVPVVFDGNFYYEAQIADLIGRLEYEHYVFTLQAPLSLCIARDAGRVISYGSEAARDVFRKSTEFESGVGIDATRPLDAVVADIVSRLS
jgi:predicted kinase